MKLKTVDNMVSFYMLAGKDVVRNKMNLEAAETVIKQSKEVTKSDRFEGFSICVDGKFFFEGSFKEKKKTSSVVEPKEVPTEE